ncbi:MAG: hypothetical protein JXA77_02595 [Bacteroidales bacterium]|nr:hypothetical protein [Bacteroidales bacterium]MBN2817829.1 hypothetical protein [Bacteroidales bacterium]
MNRNKNHIAIIIPYFGNLPAWIDFFCLSCSYNNSIDWLIFTDSQVKNGTFKNVIFIPFSLADFNLIATEKLGFKVNVQNTYKLCDYKPTYGSVFSDYLKSYEYWGYGDLDVIYGNIMSFIYKDIESNSDIISMHKDFVPGHFCILKNSIKIISLFREITHYKKILQSNKYYGLDERIHILRIITYSWVVGFSKKVKVEYLILREKIILFLRELRYKHKHITPNKTETVIYQSKDFSSLVSTLSSKGDIIVSVQQFYKCDFSFRKKNITNWNLLWDKGFLQDSSDKMELMYFHFQLSKERNDFHTEKPNFVPEHFNITDKGILV